MGEFALIDLIRQRAGEGGSDVLLGMGDDAAVLKLPDQASLVATTDTLNLGVHFSRDDPPEAIGHKALAVNLSDLAAMGARPRWILLSLSLQGDAEAWVRRFISGFLPLARSFGVSLVGGDTTAGPLSVSVTALGSCAGNRFLGRNGARPGDLVVVSGELGDAALALHERENGRLPPPAALDRLQWPLPRVELGATLVGNASACIDVSDGLLADLGHIAAASGCGAVIEAGALPASGSLEQCSEELRWRLQLTGGDDYELCFTWPAGDQAGLERLSSELDLRLTVVGTMLEGQEVRCLDPSGRILEYARQGYTHRL